MEKSRIKLQKMKRALDIKKAFLLVLGKVILHDPPCMCKINPFKEISQEYDLIIDIVIMVC